MCVEEIILVLLHNVSQESSILESLVVEVIRVLEQRSVGKSPDVSRVGIEYTLEVDGGCLVAVDDIFVFCLEERARLGDDDDVQDQEH